MWCCLSVAVCLHAHSSVNPPSLPHTLYTHALPFTLPCPVLLPHCSRLFQRAAQQPATRTGLGLCDPQPMRCLTSTVRDLSHFGVFTLLCQFAHNSTHTTTYTAHAPRAHMHSPYCTHTHSCARRVRRVQHAVGAVVVAVTVTVAVAVPSPSRLPRHSPRSLRIVPGCIPTASRRTPRHLPILQPYCSCQQVRPGTSNDISSQHASLLTSPFFLVLSRFPALARRLAAPPLPTFYTLALAPGPATNIQE